ncbi:hypothetical protein L7F22_036443 [Adiantum nelumboides]|nr:hypothetical protein [Adiantum nelumboides]
MASSSESGNLLHIRKLEEAHNFAIWKKQCYNVMLQKKHAKPIKLEGRKPDDIEDEEWEEMDELARSTIMLSVSDSLLFNVENEKSAWGMWKGLDELYAQQSAASKVYWLKKLMDLHDMRAEMAKIPYASAVGSLMYAMVATRPDIAFAEGVASRYMSNLGKKHWESVKCILRYLKGTKDLCICFGKSETCVHGFTDANFARHPDYRKSTSRYVFTFTGGAVSWISRLQKCVALSTTEAEYVAATEASKEALWLMRLVEELGIKSQVPVLHCDSQSAIMLARNPVFHAKTKHIEVKYHFIRSVLDDKSITLVKVHTDDNPADLLTKGLPVERFAYCHQMMGIG